VKFRRLPPAQHVDRTQETILKGIKILLRLLVQKLFLRDQNLGVIIPLDGF